MKSSQKVALSLLVAVVVFSAFTVVSFSGLFHYIDATFYNPRIRENAYRRLDGAVASVGAYHEKNRRRFEEILSQPSVKAVYQVNQSREDIQNQQAIFGALKTDMSGFMFVRFIDNQGQRLHFSTLESDIAQSGPDQVTYKPPGAITDPVPLAGLALPQSTPFDLMLVPKGDLYIYRFLVKDQYNIVQGTALFYVSARGITNALISDGFIDPGTTAAIVSDRTLLLNRPEKFGDALSQAVTTAWSPSEVGNTPLLKGDSGGSFFLFSRATQPTGYALMLMPESDFHMRPIMQWVLLAGTFLTAFLLMFLLLNIRQDAVLVLSDRIKRFQIHLLQEYLEEKEQIDWKRWQAQLEERREEVSRQIKKGIGRVHGKKAEEIDRLINQSWDEILTVLGTKQLEARPSSLDVSRLEDIIQRAVSNFQQLGVSTGSTSRTGSARRALPVETAETGLDDDSSSETVEELDEVEEAEAVEETEPVEEAEAVAELEEAEEAEAVEDAEPIAEAEAVEELDEVEGAEAIEEAEPVEEAETVEELDEVEEAEAVEEAEPVEEAEAVEEVEAVEELDEVEEAEAVEEAEPVEEAEAVEEVEAVEELDEVEEAEAIEEAEPVEEAEAVEEVEAVEELDEVEEAEAVEEAEPVEEAEAVEEVEAVEELDEVEEAEVVEEAEPVEEAEAVEEVEAVEELDEVEEAEAIEEAEPVEEAEAVEDAEPLEEVEAIEELDKVEEAEAIEEAEPVEEAETVEELDEGEELEFPDFAAAPTEEELRVPEEILDDEPIADETAAETAKARESSSEAAVPTAGEEGEIEQLEELDEVEAAEVPEEVGEPDEAEELEAAEELDEVGELEEAEELEAVGELEEAEELEAVGELEEAEPEEVGAAVSALQGRMPSEREHERPWITEEAEILDELESEDEIEVYPSEALPISSSGLFMASKLSFGGRYEAFAGRGFELPELVSIEPDSVEEVELLTDGPGGNTVPPEMEGEEALAAARAEAASAADRDGQQLFEGLSPDDYEIVPLTHILALIAGGQAAHPERDQGEVPDIAAPGDRKSGDAEEVERATASSGSGASASVGGIDDILSIHAIDLFPAEYAEKRKGSASPDSGPDYDRRRVRFDRDGLDYDWFMRRHRQTESGIIKSLVEVTRIFKARAGSLFLETEKGYRATYSLGLDEACMNRVIAKRETRLFRDVFENKHALLLRVPLNELPNFRSVCEESQFAHLQKSLFLPVKFNRKPAYLLLSVHGDADSFDSLFAGVLSGSRAEIGG